MLLYNVGVDGLFVVRLVSSQVSAGMGSMDGDEFVGVVED